MHSLQNKLEADCLDECIEFTYFKLLNTENGQEAWENCLKDFKRWISENNYEFDGNGQKDANEFLSLVLEEFNNNLSTPVNKQVRRIWWFKVKNRKANKLIKFDYI